MILYEDGDERNNNMSSDEMSSSDGVSLSLDTITKKRFKVTFEFNVNLIGNVKWGDALAKSILQDKFNASNISIEEVVPDTK